MTINTPPEPCQGITWDYIPHDKAMALYYELEERYSITNFMLAENIPNDKAAMVSRMLEEGYATVPRDEDQAWFFDVLSKYDKAMQRNAERDKERNALSPTDSSGRP